jgi:heterodisulfide reductase subunit C
LDVLWLWKKRRMDERADMNMNAILRNAGVYCCVECGKCVAVCPMQEMYPNFSIEMSPRGMIKKSLFVADMVLDENLWYCTECNACTDTCPEEVSCRELIRGLRNMAVKKGLVENAKTCCSCGAVYVPVPVLDYLHERLKKIRPNYMDLCPSCRRQIYLRRNA